MLLKLIDKKDAGADYDSGWIQVSELLRKNDGTTSVQIQWDSIAGGTDGTIVISYTNDPNDTKVGIDVATYTVDTAAEGNTLLIDMPFEFIKAVYTKNSITTGNIYVYASKGVS